MSILQTSCKERINKRTCQPFIRSSDRIMLDFGNQLVLHPLANTITVLESTNVPHCLRAYTVHSCHSANQRQNSTICNLINLQNRYVKNALHKLSLQCTIQEAPKVYGCQNVKAQFLSHLRLVFFFSSMACNNTE